MKEVQATGPSSPSNTTASQISKTCEDSIIAIIQSLKSNSQRLRQKQYKSLPPTPSSDELSAYRRSSLSLLEAGLREALQSVEPDLILNKDGPIVESTEERIVCIQDLCEVLNSIVNTDWLRSDTATEPLEVSRYKNLDTLVRCLDRETQEYDLIYRGVEKGITLFHTDSQDSIEKAKDIVDRFLSFFRSLIQSPFRELPSQRTTRKQQYFDPTPTSHDRLHQQFEGLVSRLRHMYQGSLQEHRVLLELVDPSEGLRDIYRLFLSNCGSDICWNSKEWFRAQFEQQSKGSEKRGSMAVKDLCDLLNWAWDEDCLNLALIDEKLHLFDGVSTSLPSPDSPDITLSKLLDDRAFDQYDGWRPGATENRFGGAEKRSLCAKLVLGLSSICNLNYNLHSWDARNIYFLTESRTKRIKKNEVYALCSPRDDQSSSTQPERPEEVYLAKLLLEIEYGPFQVKETLNRERLLREINDGLHKDLTRSGFLRAVKDCLFFEIRLRKELRQAGNATDQNFDIAYEATKKAMRIAEDLRPSEIKYRYTASSVSDMVPNPVVVDRPPEIYHSDSVPTCTNTSIGNTMLSACENEDAFDKTREWLQNHANFTNKLLEEGIDNSKSTPIKIAILDTGLEKTKGAHGPADYRDFIMPEREQQDDAGHGTQMFKVLRRIYSGAKIYVGRVFDTNDAGPKTAGYMEKGIAHAIDTKNGWGVDIVALPSGFKDFHGGIYQQIKDGTARSPPVLFFAAAANWGNKGVAFPARLASQDNVFAIYSTNAQNKPTPDFNPAALENPPSFAIFGEDFAFSKRQVWNGTSVSTMVAAGIAAQLLAFALHAENQQVYGHFHQYRRFKGISAIFLCMSYPYNGFQCIWPEKLSSQGESIGRIIEMEIRKLDT